MNVKTLILADIHNRWDKAEKIINHEAPDKIVFLGDYFDDFGDDFRIAKGTAEWLSTSLNAKNRIHLMGNHDTNYAFKHRSYKCSGYSQIKDFAINDVLNDSDWRRLPLYTWVGSWLCSHAGVHPHFYIKYSNSEPFKDWLETTCNEALKAAFRNEPSLPILSAGQSRGGIEVYGGINWCDANEFAPIDGINQIFGHTPQRKPRWINKGSPLTKLYSQNLCLDITHCNYYAIHDDVTDQIETKWIEDI